MTLANDYSGQRERSVTVYCWSRTEPKTKKWDEAESLGYLLASSGFTVITGGYCGSMEAVSKGARRAVDALKQSTAAGTTQVPEVVGILVPGQFPDRVLSGNQYLTTEVHARSMTERLDMLSSRSRYYIALPGTLGTLQELTLVWGLGAFHVAGRPRPLVICWRDPWETLVKAVESILHLPKEIVAALHYVDTPDEAMTLILKDSERASPTTT